MRVVIGMLVAAAMLETGRASLPEYHQGKGLNITHSPYATVTPKSIHEITPLPLAVSKIVWDYGYSPYSLNDQRSPESCERLQQRWYDYL